MTRESGEAILRRRFAAVERIDLATVARFGDRDAAAGYLAGLGLPDAAQRLPPTVALTATGAPTVFVAC